MRVQWQLVLPRRSFPFLRQSFWRRFRAVPARRSGNKRRHVLFFLTALPIPVPVRGIVSGRAPLSRAFIPRRFLLCRLLQVVKIISRQRVQSRCRSDPVRQRQKRLVFIVHIHALLHRPPRLLRYRIKVRYVLAVCILKPVSFFFQTVKKRHALLLAPSRTERRLRDDA